MAIDVLASGDGERWLVLGDLKELGEDAVTHHSMIGEYARERSVDRIFALGELSRSTVTAFGNNAQWFDDREGLQDQLSGELGRQTTGVTVLVKGSRSMSMDLVVDALVKNYSSAELSVVGGAI